MIATRLAAAERTRRPWKNAGGATEDVLMWPPTASLDDFDWRLSIAEVREPGPFSVFPGIERTLCVLEGRIELQIDGVPRPQVLAPDTAAIGFPGDVRVFGRPLGGPVRDLNLMVRRGAFIGAIHAQPAGLVSLPQADAGVTVLVAPVPMTVQVGPATHDLQWLDALRLEPDGVGIEPVRTSAPVLLVTVRRRGEAGGPPAAAPAHEKG